MTIGLLLIESSQLTRLFVGRLRSLWPCLSMTLRNTSRNLRRREARLPQLLWRLFDGLTTVDNGPTVVA